MGSFTFDEREVEHLKDDLARAYRDRNAPVILQVMRTECPVDLGILRQQHRVDPGVRKVAGGYLIRFRALPYWGVYVARGHGVIVPVKAKVLRFRLKTGQVIFTKRVRAVKPNPWMFRAFQRCGLYNVKVVFR